MAGTLNIVFTQQPVVGDETTIRVEYLTNLNTYEGVRLTVRWVNTRTRSGEVAIASSLSQSVTNFVAAIGVDFGNVGGYLNITSSKPSAGATESDLNVRADNWRWAEIIGETGYLTYTINNVDTSVPKTVTFTGYDQSGQDCLNPVALFDLTGGVPPYNVFVDGDLDVQGVQSPVSVPVRRNYFHILRFTDSNGDTVGSKTLKTPRNIIPADIKPQIDNTPNGATVTINVDYISSFLLPLQYSLDGNTFSEENVFTGQMAGTYTVYVKDAFGCVRTKVYTIDGQSTVTDIIFQEPSVINPFRWAKVEPGKLNRYNTLSFNQNKDLAYPFNHLVVDGDEPVNQIKTNAEYLNIYAVNCGDVSDTYELTPVKRSNHIGQELKTSATQFSTENGLLGLYFGAVNILDPLTEDITDTKDYGYQLPYAFDKIGRYVDIFGFGKLPVQSVIYDENYEAFVLQFNVTYSGNPITTNAYAEYNIQNYEIYEFITPVSDMPDSFQVVMEAGVDSDNISHTFISEVIEKTIDSKDLTEIVYWNTTNIGSMNYATGITHKIRLHSVLSRIADEQTVEGYNGDVERYNTSQEIFDGEEFIFGYLSDEMVRKVRAILAHDRLFINGVLYRLKDVPELNSRYSTNLCELTAILSKGGDGTESFDTEIVQPITGEGVDESTYQLENAIAAAKNKALILWKK